MKRVAIQQPNYFPWLGYFAKIARADVFVFLDDVAYQSGNAASVTSRTRVKTANGPVLLSVPVRKAVSGLICDTTIDDSGKWAHKHLQTFRFAYAKSRHLDEVLPLVERVLGGGHERLAALNADGVRAVCEYLSIPTPLVLASSLGVASAEKNARIVEICARLGADTYLSGAGARRYNDPALFASRGIALEYAGYQAPEYPQLHGPFVPGLSVLDALFNCGPGTGRLLS